MLKTEIEHFLTYCKVSDFSGKSIETFTIRLNEFKTNLGSDQANILIYIQYFSKNSCFDPLKHHF